MVVVFGIGGQLLRLRCRSLRLSALSFGESPSIVGVAEWRILCRLQFLAQLLKMFGAWSITAVKATGVRSPQSVVVKHTVDLLSLVAAPK